MSENAGKRNDKLRKARRKRMWTIEQAAAQVRVSPLTFQRWESGIQTPHLSTLRFLCDAFDATPEELGFEDFYE